MIMGMSRATPMAFANEVPTSSEPSRPGPRVNAIAVSSEALTPALESASLTTGTMLSSWARDASSGTTPP